MNRISCAVAAIILVSATQAAETRRPRLGPIRRVGPPVAEPVDNILGSLSTPLKRLRAAASKGLSKGDQADVRVVIDLLKNGEQAAAMGRWEAFVTRIATGGAANDINAIIQMVLREGYVEQNGDLKFYADEFRHFNDVKKKLRDHMQRMQTQEASWGQAARTGGPNPKPVIASCSLYGLLARQTRRECRCRGRPQAGPKRRSPGSAGPLALGGTHSRGQGLSGGRQPRNGTRQN